MTAQSEPQVVALREMTNEEYHADTTHDSHSSLSLFIKSPALYYHRRITGRIPAPPQSDALRLGTATHAAILEPENLAELVAVAPAEVLSKSGSRSGKAYDDWAVAQGTRTIIKQSEMDSIRWMIENVADNDQASALIERAKYREQCVFWTDADGNHRKARFDAVLLTDSVVVDIKTARDPGPEWWRSVRDYGYHRQSAWYRDAFVAAWVAVPTVAHIVIGNEAPHEVFVWTLPERAIQLGYMENAVALKELAACRGGMCPWRRQQFTQELEIPRWFYE